LLYFLTPSIPSYFTSGLTTLVGAICYVHMVPQFAAVSDHRQKNVKVCPSPNETPFFPVF
jgi:hypothetical protein